MRVLIFGTGKFYENRKCKLLEYLSDDYIIGFLDNNANTINKMNGLPVYHPGEICNLEYDMVILMSIYADDMHRQLLELDVQPQKIMRYFEFEYKKRIEMFTVLFGRKESRKALIISHDIGYHGGQIAALNAAVALKRIGYEVCIAAKSGDDKLIKEINDIDIDVVILAPLLFNSNIERDFVMQFDIVIVNTFVNIDIACEISKIKPTIWWIHESSEKYDIAYKKRWIYGGKYNNKDNFSDIYIMAVSNIAKENFEAYYNDTIKRIVPFGLEDWYMPSNGKKEDYNKIIFCVIGNICRTKNQVLVVDVFKKLPKKYQDRAECWLIGDFCDMYGEKIYESVKNVPFIKMLGVLSREEMRKAFFDIDVVICASLEETMSIAIVEGMMNEKVCITTDATGVAEYIENGKNGIICKAGDEKTLKNAIIKTIDEYNEYGILRKKARETYDNYFSLKCLEQELEKVVNSVLFDN